MISISIPGFGELTLEHLVLDYNGTLAVDGEPVPGVIERINRLSKNLQVHVVTADTFCTVEKQFAGQPCTVQVLGKEKQDEAKLAYVRALGAGVTACIGNGRNDCLMIEACALGMAVILAEGAFSQALQQADLVFTSITDALDVLAHPLRLTASLRS
ncbi:MAG TPA: ATPase P [Spirochaetota bacterium]|nr:ATPase P [Spirochaetota bacterium]HPI89286.1 ATPase P [Spirochaetota bacterium]HPR48554.1 ATPase P [Spirochaetota bacterium]